MTGGVGFDVGDTARPTIRTTAHARRARRAAVDVLAARHAAEVVAMTTPPGDLDQIMVSHVRARHAHERAARIHRRGFVVLIVAVAVNVAAALWNMAA